MFVIIVKVLLLRHDDDGLLKEMEKESSGSSDATAPFRQFFISRYSVNPGLAIFVIEFRFSHWLVYSLLQPILARSYLSPFVRAKER